MNWYNKIPVTVRFALVLLVGALLGIPIQSSLSGNGSQSAPKSSVWYCTGCSTKPPVTPTPPTGTGGSTGTGGTSSVDHPFVQPTCNAPTLKAPDPKRFDEYRKSLKPRHKVMEQGFFLSFASPQVSSVGWKSNNPFCGDQGYVGACEAFTQLDIACALPRGLSFSTQAAFNSAALDAYKWITANDPFPGTWPSVDTGSDSMTGCKWLVKNGYAKSCQILSGASAVKVAIQSGPVISGMNWRDKMMVTDRCGFMDIGGVVDGGHAVGLFQFNAEKDLWDLVNHWGQGWGTCVGSHCGHFLLTTAQLFSPDLDADFVQPVLQ